MNPLGNLIKLALVVALGFAGVTLARHAFTHGMTNLISFEVSGTSASAASFGTVDNDCVMYGRPGSANRCHAEAMWAREETDSPAAPSFFSLSESDEAKDSSYRTALWFGAAMLAGLLALGGVGACVMWVLRD